ncbi:unnamed protein product, partial [Phaeothamnion confervicola]
MAEDGDEIEQVGRTGGVALPHARPDCLAFPFRNTDLRIKYCDTCFCYVCDGPAKSCPIWQQHHCAVTRGIGALHWRKLRRAAQEKRRAD